MLSTPSLSTASQALRGIGGEPRGEARPEQALKRPSARAAASLAARRSGSPPAANAPPERAQRAVSRSEPEIVPIAASYRPALDAIPFDAEYLHIMQQSLDVRCIRSPMTQKEVIWKPSSQSASWQSSSAPSTVPANVPAVAKATMLVAGMHGAGVAGDSDEPTRCGHLVSAQGLRTPVISECPPWEINK